MTLVLTRSILEQLVDAPATVAAVREIMRAVAAGSAVQPAPVMVTAAGAEAEVLLMAASGPEDVAVTKVLADAPANAQRGLPTQRSVIVLSRPSDGATLAILDGRVPTRERTAAATAVATDALARAGSTTLGLLGAGGLAAPHLRALRTIRPFRRAQVWSRTRERVDALRASVADLDIEIVPVPSPREAVDGVDVVCTLTPSREPVLRGSWLEPGQHVNAVGAPPRQDHREVDSETMVRATVFVDDVATVRAKSGDALIPLRDGAITARSLERTLGAVLNDTHPGRRSDEEITLYNSVGVGMQDLAVARLLVQTARSRGLGIDLDLSA